MSQIVRFADHSVKVPRDLQYGVEAVLWWWLEAELFEPEDEAFRDSVRRFIRSRSRVVSARAFSNVRNLVDGETLNGWCECPEDGPCEMCMWCQAMILRDWLDGLLDAGGHHRGSYVEAYCSVKDPAEPAAAWERNDCGTHKRAVA